jgi:hypothetical protein
MEKVLDITKVWNVVRDSSFASKLGDVILDARRNWFHVWHLDEETDCKQDEVAIWVNGMLVEFSAKVTRCAICRRWKLVTRFNRISDDQQRQDELLETRMTEAVAEIK